MPHPYLQDWLVEAHDRRDEVEDVRVIVVVGMHRSGTSLVTRGLNALGVPLGDNVLSQSAPDNEKGHWEDIDVREFNERMMASLALQWDVIGAGDEAAMGAASLMPVVEEGKALVRSKLAGNRVWAFKDPRIGRLWPFWRRVLVGDPEWRVNFVWSVRHPVSVARSLRHRNGFGSLKSHLLWMHHNRAPYGDIAANRHVVVDYDRMLMQPREELGRMAVSLELGAMSGDSVDAFVNEFVDPDLRHFDRWDEIGDRRVSVGVEHAACVAYEALRSVSMDADSLRGAAFRAEWDDAYGELAKFMASAFRVDVSTLAERGLHEAEARIGRELQERQAEGISELQGQVTETLQEQFAALSGRIDETESRLRREQQEGHTAGLAGLQEQVSGTLQEQFAALSGRIDETESRLRREQQEGHTAGLAGLQEQVSGTLQEQFAALSGRIDETESRLRREQQEGHTAGLAGLQEQVSGTLQEQFAALSGRIDETESRLRREQQEGHTAGLAGLQEQVSGTLQEQFAALSGRIDETESRLRREQQEGHTAGLAGLQEQVSGTLQEQFAALSGRIDETESRLRREQQEGHTAGLAGLQEQVSGTLQEQFAALSGRIDETESRLRREQQEGHTAGLAGLQEQVSGTLQEQFAALSGRIDETESRLRREQQEGHTAGLAGLQEQVSGTLQEQFAALSGRIDETESRLRREQQEGHTAGLAGLQEQVSGTLQEQFAALSGRIDETESRLRREQQEGHTAGLAGLQEQVSGTLQEQFAVLSGRIDEVQSQWMQTRQELALLNDLLDRERYTVFKPLLRRAWRLGVAIAKRMPGPVERQLRRLKQRLLPAPVALTVDIVPADTARAPDSRPPVDLGQPLAGHHDVLVFPVIDWHFRFQRPQQLARQLAERGHRIFYLSTTFHSADQPTFQVIESPAPNVFLVTLCIPGMQPLIYQDPMSDEQRERLAAAVGELVTAGGLRSTIAIVDLPFWRRLVESVPGFLTVYDCMDYHGGFSTNSPVMIEEEDRLIASVDLVITSSAGLSELVGRNRENALIRNAGEIAYFRETPPKLAYESDRPVAGYLGAIAEWFDMDLVASAARRFPDWEFVLVGSTDYGDVSKVRKLENVKLVGEVPYTEAASWVHSFDVALIPFRLTELTLCTNPVKVYEYLAAGKPVVATALPEVKLMDDVVHVAADHARFMDLLGVAMDESGDQARAQERTQWALGHDWSDRVDRLQDSIGEAFPRVSVIVLTYDNLEFTQACLHSLEVHTQYPNWELLLVDNASNDGTQEFLADYAERNPRARLTQNEQNLGFAAGNNRGLEAADGEYLVILNNDTYVTRGWLLDLIRHMRRDPKLGLVGPVTNNIGNEAKIPIEYADMDEMQRAAVAYTSKHARQELDARVVAFFCAAMPRSVYERMGGLDERFGLGFFEDDDYCRRVEQAGFRIAIAEDVFVHHHLSASFSKLDDEKKQELFDRNRVLYEEKWGTWQPHKYRD